MTKKNRPGNNYRPTVNDLKVVALIEAQMGDREAKDPAVIALFVLKELIMIGVHAGIKVKRVRK